MQLFSSFSSVLLIHLVSASITHIAATENSVVRPDEENAALRHRAVEEYHQSLEPGSNVESSHLRHNTRWLYEVPVWWKKIVNDYDGNVKKCRLRKSPPEDGTVCTGRSKACFWGDQVCPGVGPYPTIQCECQSSLWACADVVCPSDAAATTTKGPPVVVTTAASTSAAAAATTVSPNPPPRTVNQHACPLVLNNPSGCPATLPFKFDGSGNDICESAALMATSCNYGAEQVESCCGNCYTSWVCDCFGVGQPFECYQSDSCLSPSCLQDQSILAKWDSLVGKLCNPTAINVILADYPGMSVSCIPDNSIVTLDYSLNRVRILYNAATGLVSQPPRVG